MASQNLPRSQALRLRAAHAAQLKMYGSSLEPCISLPASRGPNKRMAWSSSGSSMGNPVGKTTGRPPGSITLSKSRQRGNLRQNGRTFGGTFWSAAVFPHHLDPHEPGATENEQDIWMRRDCDRARRHNSTSRCQRVHQGRLGGRRCRAFCRSSWSYRRCRRLRHRPPRGEQAAERSTHNDGQRATARAVSENPRSRRDAADAHPSAETAQRFTAGWIVRRERSNASPFGRQSG
jgi:hypothetical protein